MRGKKNPNQHLYILSHILRYYLWQHIKSYIEEKTTVLIEKRLLVKLGFIIEK